MQHYTYKKSKSRYQNLCSNFAFWYLWQSDLTNSWQSVGFAKNGLHWSLPPECISPPPFTQITSSAKGPAAKAGIWEWFTWGKLYPEYPNSLLSASLLAIFFPQRKHLLLCLWHLKSTLNIAGDCSCVGGFPECSVTFLKEFFRRNILRHWNIALSYQNCSVTTFTNTLERWATDGIP